MIQSQGVSFRWAMMLAMLSMDAGRMPPSIP
jgi:hypothetical protein